MFSQRLECNVCQYEPNTLPVMMVWLSTHVSEMIRKVGG